MTGEQAEKLYEANYMRVFSYVMTLTGDRTEAEEITQETFFRAISRNSEFRGESNEITWLCAIAKNCFLDEKRRGSRTEPMPEEDRPDTGKGVEQTAMDRDSSLRIHMALHALEERTARCSSFGSSANSASGKSDSSSRKPRTGHGSPITAPGSNSRKGWMPDEDRL